MLHSLCMDQLRFSFHKKEVESLKDRIGRDYWPQNGILEHLQVLKVLIDTRVTNLGTRKGIYKKKETQLMFVSHER